MKLSPENCKQAIKAWEVAIKDYSKIKILINPTSVFSFNQEQIEWVKDNNDYHRFHTYIGVYKDKLILIVVPLDEHGKEKKLDTYIASPLAPLKKELVLIDTDIVTTTKHTFLSKKLNISNYWEKVEKTKHNEPILSEKVSLKEIVKWKDESLNWFYEEWKSHNGCRIFKTFTVPFPDLGNKDDKHKEVKTLFGFKHSFIYEREIPVLIFVNISTSIDHQAEICSFFTQDENSHTNTSDWSEPCPPMCRDDNFNIFD